MKSSLKIFSIRENGLYAGVEIKDGKIKLIHLGDFVNNHTACNLVFVGLPWVKPLRQAVISCPECVAYIRKNSQRPDMLENIKVEE
jgi:hypothetical protein